MSQEKFRATLAEHDARALAGGSAKARERHQAQGKILVRDRLRKLFDALGHTA